VYRQHTGISDREIDGQKYASIWKRVLTARKADLHAGVFLLLAEDLLRPAKTLLMPPSKTSPKTTRQSDESRKIADSIELQVCGF
jgi:hypothetical protein